MKNTVKIFIMMLCIGISVNLNSAINIANKTIENKLNAYDPNELSTQNPYSLDNAAEKWAQAIASQLTTAERVALAYHCLNDNNTTFANDTTPEPIKRILRQITYANVPVAPEYTRSLAETWNLTSELPWNWTTSYDIPLVGRAVSAVQGVQQAIKTVSYTKELDWPYLYQYLSNDRLKPIAPNNTIANTFWSNLIKAAKEDIVSPSFKENILLLHRQPVENVPWNIIKENLVSKIYNYLTNSFETNELIVPTNLREQIINQIDGSSLGNTFESIKPKKQTTTTPATEKPSYLDRYLQTTDERAYKNGQQNNQWYNNVLKFATDDYWKPESELAKMEPEDQKSSITKKILPYIEWSAKYYSIKPFTAQEIYDWLTKNWPPKQQGWLSWLTGGQQQQTLPQQQQQVQWQPLGQQQQQPTQQQTTLAQRRTLQPPIQQQQQIPITSQPIQQTGKPTTLGERRAIAAQQLLQQQQQTNR